MHESVLQFASVVLTPANVQGKTVLEVGSYNVNGSVRPHVESLSPESYIGVDMRAGPGVDRVIKAEDMGVDERFDVVISCEMLEHCFEWKSAFLCMARKAKETLVITARGPGFPLHSYPDDHWRFTVPEVALMCKACGITPVSLVPDWQAPGFLLIADCRDRQPEDDSLWPSPISMTEWLATQTPKGRKR